MIKPAAGWVTQGFSTAHQALDIANTPGTAVNAPHAGRVTISGDLGDCGLAIEIDGGRFKSRLCHNQTLLAGLGENVSEGQRVARMGYTGYTQPDNVPEGSHTHWVLWDNGQRVNPELYYGQEGTMPTQAEQDANYRQELLRQIAAEVSVDYKDGSDVAKVVGNIRTLYRLINEKDAEITRLANLGSGDYELIPDVTYKGKATYSKK